MRTMTAYQTLHRDLRTVRIFVHYQEIRNLETTYRGRGSSHHD